MNNEKLNSDNAPLLDDYIFKRTFTRDDPNGILRDLLESILNIKIKNVQVLNIEIPTDVLEIHFIELPKFIKKNAEAKTKLEQWLWLIAGREDKVKMSKLDNPEVKKAMKLVEEILSDPKEREIIDAREIARLNYNSGMAEAKKSGIAEERQKNEEKLKLAILKMQKANMSEEQICDILNLTKDELQKLIES